MGTRATRRATPADQTRASNGQPAGPLLLHEHLQREALKHCIPGNMLAAFVQGAIAGRTFPRSGKQRR